MPSGTWKARALFAMWPRPWLPGSGPDSHGPPDVPDREHRSVDMAAGSPDRAFGRRSLFAWGIRAALLASSPLVMAMSDTRSAKPGSPAGAVALEPPDQEGRLTLEATLARRRSVRDFAPGSLTLPELSQLLWAGQGITSQAGYRTAPSAGALYPLELYVAVGEVGSLAAGVYRYRPSRHALDPVASGDRRTRLSRAALSQTWIEDSAAALAIAAIPHRTTSKYGERGMRYVFIEAGHAAQNICLQAVSLNLAVTPVGAFRDDDVRRVLDMDPEALPICLLPVGRK